ncbi:MAG: hypothetical protein Q4E53_01185 [Eubacteriales bacterium]|nr:hypothetical protein [Eubacteriales bacterium]
MKQNTFVVSLISTKEKLHKFYQDKHRVITPILRFLLSLAVLFILKEMFPFGAIVDKTWCLVAISVIQAFLPLSFLYYIGSIFIIYNLWQVSFDLSIGFLVFVIVCVICYFRIDSRYTYLALVVPALFYLKVGIVIPAVLAVAIGFHALVPTLAGVVLYYFYVTLLEVVPILKGAEVSGMGAGVMYAANSIIKNQTFFIVVVASALTIILTSLLNRMFNERAWLISGALGSAIMAFTVMAGSLYYKVNIPIWNVLIEMAVSFVLCLIFNLFRGIGDVSRIEKTVFEDDEYIYYVKAVPKVKVSQSDRNVKIINEKIPTEIMDEAEETFEMDDEILEMDTWDSSLENDEFDEIEEDSSNDMFENPEENIEENK